MEQLNINNTVHSQDNELRDRLEDLTRLVSDWVWETDEDLNLTYVSDRVIDILGYHPFEVVDQKITEYVDPPAKINSEFTSDWRSPFRDVLVTTFTKMGDLRYLRVSSMPKFDPDSGKFMGARGTAKDVTEEEATKESLVIALAEAKLASRAKSDFLASMSHEFRTPMNAILGFSEFLLNNPSEKLSESQQGYTTDIHQSGQHLMELINQVLDLTQIETRQDDFEYQTVNAFMIADECRRMISARAERLDIKISNMISEHNLPLLWTNESKCHQIFLNLLSNAVKYNRKEGQVTLSAQKTSPTHLRLSIRDTGVGIPVERQTDLFKPFDRLGREAGEIEGAGVGLTLTKLIVEQLGGELGFESEDGIGSTFWFELPIAHGEQAS